ncbi:MAG: RNA-directed DNA polymerase [Gammaproteobacteria bacterium]|nr:RNA-directed DNA polymerase [Gammaproteobacteria bacterium]
MKIRPGTFAIRAVNQYRRRDVLSYLGLRYYLENSATLTDHWARDVAVDLVLHRTDPGYMRAKHFKGVNANGSISHREMYLPGPNEALAEAVLISECANIGKAFSLHKRVFSYLPVEDNDLSGVFSRYMNGLKDRHAAISAVCREQPNAVVQFFDIKRFYPSIKTEIGHRVWEEACSKSGLSSRFRSLGEKLLFDHGSTNQNEPGRILTGPMFSHLIGNLVLAKVDEALATASAQYFRYVDDVVLVGSVEEVCSSSALLHSLLRDLDLELHDENSDKSMSISPLEWLHGEHDFADSRQPISWMTLVGDLKRLLLWHPEKAVEIRNSLFNEGFRMPLPDYTGAVRDRRFVARSRDLIQRQWFQKVVRKISPESVLNQARMLRSQYDQKLCQSLDQLSQVSGFAAKRVLPKARYCIGRLAYLATPDRLIELSKVSSEIPAFYFQSEVARAVGTGEIDRVISLGTNAAQAVAQPLRMASGNVTLAREPETTVEIQSLAIFSMNGVHVDIDLNP